VRGSHWFQASFGVRSILHRVAGRTDKEQRRHGPIPENRQSWETMCHGMLGLRYESPEVCYRSIRSSRGSRVAPVKSDISGDTQFPLLLGAWLIALVATLAALFIGEVMGQAPCNLCWFQRAFMFPLAVILAIACITSDSGVWRYAVPLAACGWLVALYHTSLYLEMIPAALEPCGSGPSCSSANMLIAGGVPIPLLSLGAFSAIIGLLVLTCRSSKP
jgi:disulfide bond formation protein DsbB